MINKERVLYLIYIDKAINEFYGYDGEHGIDVREGELQLLASSILARRKNILS